MANLPKPTNNKRLPSSLRWTIAIFLTLSSCIAAFYQVSRWSGAKTWKNALETYTADGGSLNYEDFVPTPIPTDENFAAIPFLRGITIPENLDHPSGINGDSVRAALLADLKDPAIGEADRSKEPQLGEGFSFGSRIDLHAWAKFFAKEDAAPPPQSKKDVAISVLAALDKNFAAFFSQSDSAVTRSRAQFIPPTTEFFDRAYPMNTPLTHMNAAVRLTQILHLRAIAAIHAHEPKIAIDSIRAILRMASAERPNTHGLMQFLVAYTEFKYASSALWESLEQRAFAPLVIAALQAEFAAQDFLDDFATSMRVEAVAMCNTLAAAINGSLTTSHFKIGGFSVYPKGWIYDSRAAILTNIHQDGIVPFENRDFASFQTRHEAFESQLNARARGWLGHRWYFLTIMTPVWGSVGASATHSQTLANQSQIACALERHFLKHQSYPDTLAALVPEFLQSIPEDPIDSEPMRYHRTSDGRYLLYSIGWDLTDGGGVPDWDPFTKKNTSITKGDWVWSYRDLRPE